MLRQLCSVNSLCFCLASIACLRHIRVLQFGAPGSPAQARLSAASSGRALRAVSRGSPVGSSDSRVSGRSAISPRGPDPALPVAARKSFGRAWLPVEALWLQFAGFGLLGGLFSTPNALGRPHWRLPGWAAAASTRRRLHFSRLPHLLWGCLVGLQAHPCASYPAPPDSVCLFVPLAALQSSTHLASTR